MNHDALGIRFATAEADALAASEIRFDPPTAPDIAAQIDAQLEIAIGAQILRAQARASMMDALLVDFWQIDAHIEALRLEQRRVRAEAYIKVDKEPT